MSVIRYQRVALPGNIPVGDPGSLPADLEGLDDVSLADLTAAIGVPAATQLGYLDTGFLPVVFPDPPSRVPVTNSQLRIALFDAFLLDDVEAAVALLPQDVQIRWQYNSVFSVDQAVIVTIFTAALIDDPTRQAVFAAAAEVPE